MVGTKHNEPLLSVIIPVYGVEKYIAQCLESVINQTYQNLEIIVINDGTKDRSAEIAKEYAKKDARIRVYDYPNGGVSAARNRGIEHINGEYVAFLDSDDWLEPDMYKVLMSKIINSDADIVKCSVLEIDLDTNKKNIIAFNEEREFYEDTNELVFAGFLHTVIWNAVYAKNLIINVTFPENIVYEDNYVSGMYHALAKKVVVLREVYYNYRVNLCGISKGGVKRPLDKCLVFEKLINDLRVLGVDIKKYQWKLACEIYHFIRGWNKTYSVRGIDKKLYIFLLENLDLRRILSLYWYIKHQKIKIIKGDIKHGE